MFFFYKMSCKYQWWTGQNVEESALIEIANSTPWVIYNIKTWNMKFCFSV